MRHKEKLISNILLATGGAFVLAGLILFGLISRDFDAAFTKFHHIFFSNDLWLLDPAEDNLINLLPEGFFSDTVIRVTLNFIIMVAVLVVISLVIVLRARRKRKEKLTGPAF